MELKLDMNSYLPLRDVVFQTLRDAILKGEAMPIFCLSAKKSIGVKRLMEFTIKVAALLLLRTFWGLRIAGLPDELLGKGGNIIITHHNSLDVDLYLRIATELYLKRLIVGGFEGVYEIGKNFRNEGMDRNHNPEFTCMELYVQYKDYNWMMAFTEQLLERICIAVNGKPETEIDGKTISFKAPFRRLPILDAIKEKTGYDLNGKTEEEIRAVCKALNMEIDDTMGKGKLIDEIFGEFCEGTYIQPTFITDYPIEMSPLTKKHRSNPALTIGNPDIKWEKTETFNVGLDLSFFQNSLTMGVEYFNKKTSDMLLTVPTVPSAGLSSDPMTNAGSVRNYGVEGNVSYKRRFGKFSFDIGFNLSWIKNEVTSLGTGNEPIWGAYISESSIIDFVTKTEVGRPIGSFYGYVTDGIFQNYDEIKASAQYDWGKRDGEQTTRPGDFRFKDLNGDGQITSEDRTFLGSPLPDLVFGIPLQFSYGDFDLNIFFQGQTGNEIFNVMDYYLYNGAAGNVYADIRSQHWSGQVDPNRAFFPLNTEATIPDLDGDDAARNFRASDFLVQDGSYMRLKELRLTYNLPKKLIAKWNLSNLALSFTAYNLWTITGYNGLDPEVKGQDILESIITLAGKIGMDVITEGVETKKQLDMLTMMGCHEFQGYYFSKPVPVSEFEEKYLV